MALLLDYLKRIKSLPVGPRILGRLLALLQKPDLDSSEVVRLIGFDPALTASVLQRCNSAVYGLAHPVYDLEEAVVRLGYNQIYSLVAAVVGETALNAPQTGYGLAPGELWEHSAASGIAAKILGSYLPADENLLFTAALMHDIGKLVLSNYLEGKYDLVMSETEESGCSLVETERILLGAEHAEIGGLILTEWNFPQSLIYGVRFHHSALEAAPYEHLAAAVSIADIVAHIAGHGHGHQEFAVRADSDAAHLLGLGVRDLESLVLETETALSETKLFNRRA